MKKLLPCCSRMMSVETQADVRGRPGFRQALPSYFCAINLRCNASKVSGVTIVATCARNFRPNAWFWQQAGVAGCGHIGVGLPICSRVRFFLNEVLGHCCRLWFSQRATETTRNENGSIHARIG